MRALRPVVFAVALVLTGLVGTEHSAVAFDHTDAVRVPTGEAPDQEWGSADGRSHRAPTDATDAGGRGEPVAAPGELPLDGGPVERRPEEREVVLPDPGPVVEVDPPDPVAPAGFDAERSVEVESARKEREATFLDDDGTYTTASTTSRSTSVPGKEHGRRPTPPSCPPRTPVHAP
ncbi:hypothetical protein OG413_19255 [Streptomyces sp. NBC_01433]|uniref:hypothetical protein n=1 Tax=Streptomyces sp. NBC_01433 TaxID=2903864 RepID=UPI00224E1A46|nr:hypothetical protein [Streptomyces sp. NBC_01433]MCX4677412.1 hypothetical protein [Streptomyces sp. NBC_01433]